MYNIRSKEVCSEHSHEQVWEMNTCVQACMPHKCSFLKLVQAFKHGNYKINFFAVINYWNDWKWEGGSKVEDCVKILVSCEDGIE